MELWVALAVLVVIMAFAFKPSREWLVTSRLGGYLAGLLILFIFLAYGMTWSDLRL